MVSELSQGLRHASSPSVVYEWKSPLAYLRGPVTESVSPHPHPQYPPLLCLRPRGCLTGEKV